MIRWGIIIYCCFAWVFLSLELNAQTDDYVVDDPMLFEDYIYHPNIKTVLLHQLGDALSYPIIELQSGQQLKLTFDDLSPEGSDYRYTFIHCTHDWQESDIDAFDYIEGFTEGDLWQYDYSFNTDQDYTHYELLMPNEHLQFKISGNYLLKVYRVGEEDRPAFTRRLMVYEKKTEILPKLYNAITQNLFLTHQRLEFQLGFGRLPTVNPYSDIKITVLQNGRWDNALQKIPPTTVLGKTAYYRHTDLTMFRGNQEFRYFDIKSLALLSDRVKNITKDKHISLRTDQIRENKDYRRLYDINGKYVIGIFESKMDEIDSDYVWVHFSLEAAQPIENGNVYILGALTDWRAQREAQMTYNYDRAAYEGKLFLKQGYYNYMYAVKRDGEVKTDESILEGSYYLAENDYLILVYFRPFNELYDNLVGAVLFNTLK